MIYIICFFQTQSYFMYRYTRDLSSKKWVHSKSVGDDYKESASKGQIDFLAQLEHDTDIESLFLSNGTRSKRQTFDRERLCEVKTRYIEPQTAQTTKGTWMYVINQSGIPSQRVKVEECA